MAISVNANIVTADQAAVGANNSCGISGKPAGTANTDVLIVVWGLDSQASLTGSLGVPAGWTLIQAATTGIVASTHYITLVMYWALGSVNAVNQFTNTSGGSMDIGYIVMAFTGVNNTTPIDIAGTSNNVSGTVSSITANAVTVATDQSWLLIGAADLNGGSSTLFSATGFTQKANAGINASAAALYNNTPQGTGSTGTTTVNDSASSTSQVICAGPFALRPLLMKTGKEPFGTPPPAAMTMRHRQPGHPLPTRKYWRTTEGGILVPEVLIARKVA
jgi:hypothetical protein